MKIAIVVSEFHRFISQKLLEGAKSVLDENFVEYSVFSVPGSFEIPVVIKNNIDFFDGFIALGCIIKGETPHFEYISKGVFYGIMKLMTETGKPISVGIITAENFSQAFDRAGGKWNVGKSSAETLLKIIKNKKK